MLITNAEVSVSRDAMATLCSAPSSMGRLPLWRNRLPVLTSLEASRTLTALGDLWAPCGEWKNNYIADFGEKGEDGASRLASTSEHWPEYEEKMKEMMAAEVELDITPLKLEEVEKGFARNHETGERGELDISPMELGALVAIGIIEDPEQKDSENEAEETAEEEDEENASPAS